MSDKKEVGFGDMFTPSDGHIKYSNRDSLEKNHTGEVNFNNGVKMGGMMADFSFDKNKKDVIFVEEKDNIDLAGLDDSDDNMDELELGAKNEDENALSFEFASEDNKNIFGSARASIQQQ